MADVAGPTMSYSGETRDISALLGDLRTHIATGSDLSGTLATLDRIDEALRGILTEHEGMSRELLGVYEQLGIVFEVTGRLSTVHGERNVVLLFLDSLKRTYHRHIVRVMERDEAGNWRGIALGPAALIELTHLLDRAAEEGRVLVEAGKRPARSGIEETMVGPVFAGDSFVCALALLRKVDSGAPPFAASDMALLQSLTTFCGDLIRKNRLVTELHSMSVAMVRALVNAVDQKDEYTSGHSLRVAFFATLLGRELGLDERALQMLQWSALLHDVGKIGIRDDVLKKAGKLTDEEFAHMKEHPVRSHRVVEQVPQLKDALDGVLHHHERFDGKGYPTGLSGQSIPLQARIIQIADVFDALTSNRAYRAAFSWQKALSIMAEEAGSALDPVLQSTFDRLVRGRLESDPGAWEKLVQEADRFVADTALDRSGSGDE